MSHIFYIVCANFSSNRHHKYINETIYVLYIGGCITVTLIMNILIILLLRLPNYNYIINFSFLFAHYLHSK